MPSPGWTFASFVDKLFEQDDVDALREGVRVLAQDVMETEVSSQIGAAPYERPRAARPPLLRWVLRGYPNPYAVPTSDRIV
jgi:hypothetical protein